MPFEQEPTRGPSAIGNTMVVLKDVIDAGGEPGLGGPYKGISYRIEVIMSDGKRITRSGDLAPYLTTAQRQGLLDFMADLRAQAEAEIL